MPHSRVRTATAAMLMSACGLLLPITAPAQQPFPPNQEVEAMLGELVEAGQAPGIVVGLLEPDGSTRVVSRGSPGPGARPLGAQSVFEIGSITKAFTGIVLAHMVVRGEVSLEDPVSKYLPDHVTVPTYDGHPITLMDLATHTSGLPYVPDNYTPRGSHDPYLDYTLEDGYAFLADHELRWKPGTRFEYSNIGFALLGHALSRAAGTPLRDLIRERILEPTGMESTGYDLHGPMEEWTVRGHNGGEPVAAWFSTDVTDGFGGMRSSAEDLLRFLAANVAPPDTDLGRAMRLAREPRRPAGESGRRAGLGWAVVERGGHHLVLHGGESGGFDALIAFDPGRRAGVVVLANARDFSHDLGTRLLTGDLHPVLTTAELRTYEGTYLLDMGGRTVELRVWVAGERLMSELGGRTVSQLLPADEHEFTVAVNPTIRQIFTVRDGRAISVSMVQRGQAVVGQRKQ
jgi:D-alanyl-D-alanine-carboxypeptidase/D-alanyl-D-alanine-endopeptidase